MPIHSLLASYQSKSSPGHLDALKHVGWYLKSSAHLGIIFSLKQNVELEAYVHFPLEDSDVNLPAIHAFAVQTGVCRMPQCQQSPTPKKYPFRKPVPFVDMSYSCAADQ